VNQAKIFDEYTDLYRNAGDNFRLKYHAGSVLESLNLSEKTFRYLSSAFCDSHNEIEKLGYHKYFYSFCYLLTLENRLDLVLNKCCGANPENIRKIANYDFVSFTLLNMCADQSDGLFLYTFRGYDRGFDDYLYKCANVTKSELEEDPNIVLERFFGGILDTASEIILLAAKSIYKTFGVSLRSQGFSNFVFGSLADSKQVEMPSEIVFINGDASFTIPLWKFGRGEYLTYVKEGVIL
jgi:hypothetical protein